MLDADLQGVDGGGGGATVRAGGFGGTGGTDFAAPFGDKVTSGVGANNRFGGGGGGGAFLGGTSGGFGFGTNCPTMSLPFAEALDRSRLGFTEGCIARSKSGKLGFEAE